MKCMVNVELDNFFHPTRQLSLKNLGHSCLRLPITQLRQEQLSMVLIQANMVRIKRIIKD